MTEIVDIQQGFKKTKLGVIPNSWKVQRLEETCSHFKSGIGITSKDIFDTGDIPVYGGNGLRGYTNRYSHEGEYILIGRQGALCGNIQFVKGKTYVSEHAIAVQVNEQNDLEYLRYKLEHERLNRYSESSAQPGLSVAKLLKLTVSIPPLTEQQKIAEILSTWDQAISIAQKLIDELKLRNKGLAQQLLTGKKRLKGFDGEWRHVRIGDVADQQTIFNKNSEDIEVLSCTKYDGLVRSLDYFGRQVFGEDLSKYKVVPKGSFAYATNHIEEGSIGYQNLMDKGLVSPMYTVFKTKADINDEFFFRILKTDRMIYAYQSNTSGSIARRGGLRWNDFSTLHISIPSLKEQAEINSLLSEANKELQLFQQQIDTLKEQKKGLMQKLLTGEIRTI